MDYIGIFTGMHFLSFLHTTRNPGAPDTEKTRAAMELKPNGAVVDCFAFTFRSPRLAPSLGSAQASGVETLVLHSHSRIRRGSSKILVRLWR